MAEAGSNQLLRTDCANLFPNQRSVMSHFQPWLGVFMPQKSANATKWGLYLFTFLESWWTFTSTQLDITFWNPSTLKVWTLNTCYRNVILAFSITIIQEILLPVFDLLLSELPILLFPFSYFDQKYLPVTAQEVTENT